MKEWYKSRIWRYCTRNIIKELCPKCGGTDVRLKESDDGYRVQCLECGYASDRPKRSVVMAGVVWNIDAIKVYAGGKNL